jgi:hypothetical protein
VNSIWFPACSNENEAVKIVSKNWDIHTTTYCIIYIITYWDIHVITYCTIHTITYSTEVSKILRFF